MDQLGVLQTRMLRYLSLGLLQVPVSSI